MHRSNKGKARRKEATTREEREGRNIQPIKLYCISIIINPILLFYDAIKHKSMKLSQTLKTKIKKGKVPHERVKSELNSKILSFCFL